MTMTQARPLTNHQVALALLDDSETKLRQDKDSPPSLKAKAQASIAHGYALLAVADAITKTGETS